MGSESVGLGNGCVLEGERVGRVVRFTMLRFSC